MDIDNALIFLDTFFYPKTEDLATAQELNITDVYCSEYILVRILTAANPNLTSLSLDINDLSKIPNIVTRFLKLTHYTVKTNVALDIDSLAACQSITNIKITAPDLIFSKSNARLPKTDHVVLSVNELEHIPNFLFSDVLNYVHITSNRLKTITPETMQAAHNVEVFFINAPLNQNKNSIQAHQPTAFSKGMDYFNEIPIVNAALHFLIQPTPNSSEPLRTELDLSPLKKLIYLYFMHSKCCVDLKNLSACKNLNSLTVTNIEALPEGLEHCRELFQLYIYDSPITKLPHWITDFERLEVLYIRNSALKTVPSDWSNSKIVFLDLTDNQIADFKFLFTFNELRDVKIKGNPISDPLYLLEAKKKISYTDLKDWLTFDPIKNYWQILTFLHELAKTNLSLADKKWIFYQLNQQSDFTIPDYWELYRAVQGLAISYKKFTEAIHHFLQKHERNTTGLQTFGAGNVIYFDGKFLEKKTILNQKLGLLNIKISLKLDDSVTHVVLGNRPTAAASFFQHTELPFLLERQLYALISKVGSNDKFFIVEQNSGETAMVDNVKQLLASRDAASAKIGLSMLQSGGIPETAIEDLVLACKTAPDEKVRTEARKLLKLHAPSFWLPVLNDRLIYLTIERTDELKLKAQLRRMLKTVSKPLVLAFALLLYKKFKKGLSFVLAEAALGSAERLQAFNFLTEGDCFNFHQGIGEQTYFYALTKYSDQPIIKRNDTAFPSDYPNPEKLRVLIMQQCNLQALPKDITLFKNVEYLNLSQNFLKKIEVSIAQLQNLKELDLKYNFLTEFPSVVYQLKNLKVLDLRYANQREGNNDYIVKLEIPEIAKHLLPDCEIWE